MERSRRERRISGTAVKAVLLSAFIVCSPFFVIPDLYAAFEDLGFGARAPGMGDSFVAVADDVGAVYYNPAGLATIERPKVQAAHSMLYSGLNDGSSLGLTNVAAASPLAGGKLGAVGFLWNQFSLAGVYTERTVQASYGFRFPRASTFEKFAAGAAVKYLSHTFSRLDEAYNSMDNMMAGGGPDPVLTGNDTKSSFDADAGLLYFMNKKYTLGAAVMNVRQADVGFSSVDKVPMKVRAGGSYRSLWTLVSAEGRLQKGPGGKLDKDFVLAAEKIFPSLDRGDVGVRASLAAGDRDFRQATAGLSYRIHKVQFDYAFSIPLGTVQNTVGNHRLAMVYTFGAPTSDEQHAAQLLDEYRQLREGADYSSSRNTMNLNDPRLKDVKNFINQENFYAANKLFSDKIGDLLPDRSAVNLSKRLGLVSAFYPVMPREGKRSPADEMLAAGIQNFLRGNDAAAVKQISFAQAENTTDSGLSNFLDKVEETTHLKGDRVPPGFTRGYVQYKFQESDTLYASKKYDDSLRLLQDILGFDPENVLALKKSGSCEYLLGNYSQARADWESAIKKETDPEEKEKLSKMVADANKKATGQGSWEPTDTGRGQLAPGALDGTGRIKGGWTPTGKAAAPAAQPEEIGGPREIEKLYQQGVDHYTKGDYGKAADTFRKILALDPENSQAKKALERIMRLSR